MNRIFVDTWAWYALTDAAEESHLQAQQASEQLLHANYTLVTTNFVLDEAVTLIHYNLHHAAAVRFWHMVQSLVQDGLVELVRVSEKQEAAAWAIMEQYEDQDFSYTDCTSFAVMRELELNQVFTADHHFATMGFILVP